MRRAGPTLGSTGFGRMLEHYANDNNFLPKCMEVSVNWRQKMAPLGAVFGVPSTVP